MFNTITHVYHFLQGSKKLSLTSVRAESTIFRFEVDSRMVQDGTLFFALPGANNHGADFLSDAFGKGAVAAIVEEHIDIPSHLSGKCIFKVKDSLQTLQSMAKAKVNHYLPKVVAITGSVGKTSSKTFLDTLLKCKFKVMCTPGNQNSQIGLPLALLNDMEGTEDILILEMGMSEKGNIRRLVEIAPPTIALVTHVDIAHIQNFDSLENIAEEKAAIFSHPNTEMGFFSDTIEYKDVFYRTGNCQKKIFSRTFLKTKKLLEQIKPPFSEKHMLNNLCGVMEVALYLGITLDELSLQIPFLTLPDKRLSRVEKESITFINDSYNACPVSMRAGLESMPDAKMGRKKVAILGEMGELGAYSEECHEDVGTFALTKVDSMYCLGPKTLPIVKVWEKNKREVYYYEKLSDLIKDLKQYLVEGDVVFVKGSKVKEMWKIVEGY